MASAMITPQMVGQAFVNQYYNVLHQSPHLVHRFYTDSSRLTRADSGADAIVHSASNQAEIHKMVMSLGYAECRAEIKTVDSQDSFAGSVLVLVSGAMHRNNCRRDFVQSFFLAPQERGYYVLNDILRYLDEETPAVESVKLANGAVEILETLQIAPEAEHDESALPPSDREEDAAAEEMPGFPEHRGVVEVEEVSVQDRVCLPIVEPVSIGRAGTIEQHYAPDDLQNALSQDASAEKKSYASILRVSRDNYDAGAQPASAWISSWQTSSKPEQPVPSHQLYTPSGLATIRATGGAVAVNTRLEDQANVRSVYVRNLPLSITSLQLQEELGRFGSIKPNGITVRTNKGVCYAFVEFEDSSSAQNAIEVSSVLVGGRKAYIEGKKSTFSGGRGRGHSLQGRSNFQRDGPHITGTASEMEGDRDAPNTGHGARSMRGGYGALTTHASNDSRGIKLQHGDFHDKSFSQASNGNRPPRRATSSRS